MRFLVVPGPDGTVDVIETGLQRREPVKVAIGNPATKSVAVPDEIRIASFKIISFSTGAPAPAG
jgi:hypothetical protein